MQLWQSLIILPPRHINFSPTGPPRPRRDLEHVQFLTLETGLRVRQHVLSGCLPTRHRATRPSFNAQGDRGSCGRTFLHQRDTQVLAAIPRATTPPWNRPLLPLRPPCLKGARLSRTALPAAAGRTAWARRRYERVRKGRGGAELRRRMAFAQTPGSRSILYIYVYIYIYSIHHRAMQISPGSALPDPAGGGLAGLGPAEACRPLRGNWLLTTAVKGAGAERGGEGGWEAVT